MRKLIIIAIAVSTLFMGGCATTPGGVQGAWTVGSVGAIAGAIVDHKNPWRGAVIGGAVMGSAGAAAGDEAEYRAREDQQRRDDAYRIEQERRAHPAYETIVNVEVFDGYAWRWTRRRVIASWYYEYRAYGYVNPRGNLIIIR